MNKILLFTLLFFARNELLSQYGLNFNRILVIDTTIGYTATVNFSPPKGYVWKVERVLAGGGGGGYRFLINKHEVNTFLTNDNPFPIWIDTLSTVGVQNNCPGGGTCKQNFIIDIIEFKID